MEDEKQSPRQDDRAARAKWLAEQLRLRLNEAMARQRGADAFLHLMRSDQRKNV
jgi:hypothetical protein